MMIQFEFPGNVPRSEISHTFIQGMANRMGMSYFKYGRIAEAYPDKVDAIESLGIRLKKYRETGNTEYLMDVANFAMIEFMRPKHPNAHFESTDSNESPGRKWIDEKIPNTRNNKGE